MFTPPQAQLSASASPAGHGLFHRRTVAAVLEAAPALWLGSRALPSVTRRLTPQQTERPFYPVTLPKDTDFDLLRNGSLSYTVGQASWLQGSVTDIDGKPVRGAKVEIWQCDQAGHYDHPGDGGRIDEAFQGFGRVVVSAQGDYLFRTIRPVAYGGRAPHIHVKARLANRELLTTQIYVAGETLNQHDFLWRTLRGEEARMALTVPFVSFPDGLRAQFNMVVQT